MSFWDSLTSIFRTKQAKIESKPEKENHGASWNNPTGVRNPYKNALPAYGNHGYLYAAINRACEDLSALDLRLVKGRGKSAKEIFEHPILDLLNQPSAAVDLMNMGTRQSGGTSTGEPRSLDEIFDSLRRQAQGSEGGIFGY